MEKEDIPEWLDEEIEVTFTRSVSYSAMVPRGTLARKLGIKPKDIRTALIEEDEFSGWDSGEKDMAEALEAYAKPSNDTGDSGPMEDIEIDGESF